MGTTVETTLSLHQALFEQAERVAQQLHLSPSALVELALEHFIKTQQSQNRDPQPSGLHRAIKQGEIYWLQVTEASRSERGYPHPHVVIQDDALNGSRIHTVVVCALTSNLKRASEPGNLLLDVGEANLTRQSAVIVSQVEVVDKMQLGEYIGALSQQRIEQVLAGMRFQQALFAARDQAR